MKRSVEVFRAKVVTLLDAQLGIIKDYSNIQVDEKTLKNAKAVYEATSADAMAKTAEIPELNKNENGEYTPKAQE